MTLAKYPVEKIQIVSKGHYHELSILTGQIHIGAFEKRHITDVVYGVAYALHLPDDIMEIVCQNNDAVVWAKNEVFENRANFSWQIAFQFIVYDDVIATQLRLIL